MSLRDRLFGHKSSSDAAWRQVIKEAEQAMARGEDPRHSEVVGDLLGLFWSGDEKALRVLQFHLFPYARNAHYMTNLYSATLPRLARRLLPTEISPFSGCVASPFYYLVKSLRAQTPELPATPEARYTATISALRAFMPEYMPDSKEEFLNALVRLIKQPAEVEHMAKCLYADIVRLAEYLQAVELHGDCSELLVATNKAILQRHGGMRNSRIEISHEALGAYYSGALIGMLIGLPRSRQALWEYFVSLPPEAIPQFWKMLKAAETSEEFWPVVARMRDKRAIPFLLDALPVLPLDGQSAILSALRNIGDARVVPILQLLAADEKSLLAPIAAQALAHILQHSREDAAQLLRPTDARHAGNAGNTLLRPSAAAPTQESRPAELLRPGSEPTEKGP